MRTQKALAPERPFFIHFAPATSHGPHQPPLSWRGRNKGRLDMGWDRYREHVLRRQLELGVVPPGTRLTQRPDAIPAFDSFTDREKECLCRQAENFADDLEHCDHEVGRLVEALEQLLRAGSFAARDRPRAGVTGTGRPAPGPRSSEDARERTVTSWDSLVARAAALYLREGSVGASPTGSNAPDGERVHATGRARSTSLRCGSVSCPGASGERSDRPGQYLLVVDDEAAFRDVLALVLTDEGYLVRVAGDGLEALGLARREPPDLVLLDVMMPRVSGHEVLAAMARDVALSSVPVLVMSGSSWDGTRHDGANVVGFVKKPVHLEALLQKIAVVLA